MVLWEVDSRQSAVDVVVGKLGRVGRYNAVQYQLEPWERCETDDGYRGSAPVHVKLPTLPEEDPVRAAIQQRVRNRQETANKQFKNWAILAVPYRHKLLDHQSVFRAIVVLTQLSFVENPLFQVDYDDL